MAQFAMLKVPVERAAQLKLLASSCGVTVTDLLGQMILSVIRAGIPLVQKSR